jgi:hypothetical protein
MRGLCPFGADAQKRERKGGRRSKLKFFKQIYRQADRHKGKQADRQT